MARSKGKGGRRAPGQKKPPLTHFLCLPLVTPDSKPQLEASLEDFQDIVAMKDPVPNGRLANAGAASGDRKGLQTIHPKAIRPAGALHCTLGVMSLDKDGLARAVETLEGLDVSSMIRAAKQSEVTEVSAVEHAESRPPSTQRPISPPPVGRYTGPIKVTLKGLVSMHSPQKTSILYTAPYDDSDRLYRFCLAVQKLFAEDELLVPDDRQLKLHATIVNTIYAKGRKKRPPPAWKTQLAKSETPASDGEDGDEGGGEGETHRAQNEDSVAPADERSQGHGPNADAPLKIDATAVLEHFRDFVWAKDVVLDRLAICEMGAKKVLDAEGRVIAEEYKEVASVSLLAAD